MTKIKTLVWGEFRHEKKNPKVAAIYPDGMHETIAGFLRQDKNFSVSTTWLDQPEHGLTTEVLASTDVLIWWGHMAHGEVSDEVVARVRKRVLEGMGLMTADEKTYIPAPEFPKIYRKARLYVGIYLSVIAACLATGSILPLMLVGLPNLFGSWLMVIYGLTQHAGLAENVLDHRLNCRTVYMNPVNRYLYWNMNYHVEHHMFPLVPYHALPALHEAVKSDMPAPSRGLAEAYREIVPVILRQVKDPAWHVRRTLPAQRERLYEGVCTTEAEPRRRGMDRGVRGGRSGQGGRDPFRPRTQNFRALS